MKLGTKNLPSGKHGQIIIIDDYGYKSAGRSMCFINSFNVTGWDSNLQLFTK